MSGPYRELPEEDPVELACRKALILVDHTQKDLVYRSAKSLTVGVLETLRHITEAISGLNQKIGHLKGEP